MGVPLRVVGAGLPRTGTASLHIALGHLLGGRCCHMSEIDGHPFDLGPQWDTALSGGTPDWDVAFDGYVAGVDWPTSAFWEPISAAYPEALVLLSTRENTRTWLESLHATVLPFARRREIDSQSVGPDLQRLFEHFTGRPTPEWDDPDLLAAAYERHNDHVRTTVAADRLIDWQPGDGWGPICAGLGLPVPDLEFLWVNRREGWTPPA
jgi:hypothetical protein